MWLLEFPLTWCYLFIVSSVSVISVNEHNSSGLEDSPLSKVSTMIGSQVLLPCDVRVSDPNDRLLLILFYKRDIGTPIFSLDARHGASDLRPQWIDPMIFGDRVKFQMTGKSQGLLISRVRESDDALYRCRVDFLLSPTKNSRIELQVIVPPSSILISDENGRKLTGSIGPFTLGDSVVLTCQVQGGKPRPEVSWWRKGLLVDRNSEILRGSMTINTITIHNIQREDFMSILKCKASDHKRTYHSESSSVRLNMTLPPLEVKIVSKNVSVKETNSIVLVCESTGASPETEISWWKEGVKMNGALSKKLESKNSTRSSIRFRVTREDHESQVICRSQNPHMISEAIETSIKLRVLYQPRLRLVPGPSIDLSKVEEGDDVYIDCEIDSNPRVTYVKWFHEDVGLVHNVSSGIIQSNQSLVLQNVARQLSGSFRCEAENTEGRGRSNSLNLSVKFRPFCISDQQIVYGAEKNEKINASCGLQANPPPESYEWAFNSSSEVVRLSMMGKTSNKYVTYKPETDLQFGSLLCWGKNVVGRQRVPCVFHVIHSVIPEPVSNCSVVSITNESASIKCSAGWNGGLKQTFNLRIIEGTRRDNGKDYSPRVMAKTSSTSRPEFHLMGLVQGTEYKVTIFAKNKKGNSQENFITFTTLESDMSSKEKPETKALKEDFSSVLMLTMLGIFSLFLICSGLGFLLWQRKEASSSDFRNPLQIKSELCSMDHVQTNSNSNSDHNAAPDIIPINGEEDCPKTQNQRATRDCDSTNQWPDSSSATYDDESCKKYTDQISADDTHYSPISVLPFGSELNVLIRPKVSNLQEEYFFDSRTNKKSCLHRADINTMGTFSPDWPSSYIDNETTPTKTKYISTSPVVYDRESAV